MKHGWRRMTAFLGGAALALTMGLGPARAADAFLEPEQAFALKAELRDADTVVLRWAIAPKYHLYRERLVFDATQVAQPTLPPGVRKYDPNFDKEMETYYDTLEVPLAVKAGSAPFDLKVGYQGCADEGLCYAPVERSYRVDPARPGLLAASEAAGPLAPATQAAPLATVPPAAAQGAAAVPEDDSSLAQRMLQGGSLWRIGGAFILFGLLLAFTPCVLPMVPILSSIIVGEGQVTRARGLALALAYCVGMALVYTGLGVAAGLAGEGLAAHLQKPWVLLTFGALLTVLALSMFDVYQLQLPSSLQSRLSNTGAQIRGGRIAGVFAMGALSALIVGPCVAGPLAGALLYISQTGNALVGGWALFSMAVGMSVPLLLTGLSAGSLLPRAGAWMNGVKRVFGVLLLAVALWMVSPVFPTQVMMLLWGALAILCALFLHVERAAAHAGVGSYARRALGLLLLTAGLFELIGAASSGRDVLQPLAHLRGGTALAAVADGAGEAKFTRVRSMAELDQAVAAADGPVLLDFYADWCVSCKEMERMTFAHARVKGEMAKLRLLQVDVTANNADDRALMKRYKLFGPPAILLLDNKGKELPGGRVVGYVPPDRFVAYLKRASEPDA
ncbi:MAG: protein-disulfide reductase DsbD [Gammaproteobacteria bacterium]